VEAEALEFSENICHRGNSLFPSGKIFANETKVCKPLMGWRQSRRGGFLASRANTVRPYTASYHPLFYIVIPHLMRDLPFFHLTVEITYHISPILLLHFSVLSW